MTTMRRRNHSTAFRCNTLAAQEISKARFTGWIYKIAMAATKRAALTKEKP